MAMINTARIGNLLDQNVSVEYKIIQGTIITMIFCRISTGKSTHAHAQWYNSLSVGNSLLLRCLYMEERTYTHRYTMVQQYHQLCTKLLSVGNSLLCNKRTDQNSIIQHVADQITTPGSCLYIGTALNKRFVRCKARPLASNLQLFGLIILCNKHKTS